MSDRICSLESCDRPHYGRGLCSMHYQRWRQDPENFDKGVDRRRLESSLTLWERIQHFGWTVVGDCWEWNGSRTDRGYGTLRYGHEFIVPRHMYRLFVGEIPEGMFVRHKCDNPPCCRPDHLELGSQADNMRDKTERLRDLSYASGRYGNRCKKGRHDITKPGALMVKQVGDRTYHRCRECVREADHRKKRKQRMKR